MDLEVINEKDRINVVSLRDEGAQVLAHRTRARGNADDPPDGSFRTASPDSARRTARAEPGDRWRRSDGTAGDAPAGRRCLRNAGSGEHPVSGSFHGGVAIAASGAIRCMFVVCRSSVLFLCFCGKGETNARRLFADSILLFSLFLSVAKVKGVIATYLRTPFSCSPCSFLLQR